jgi:molybdopterin converting factor subunit 1
MITVEVKIFAMARDLVGLNETVLSLPAGSPAGAVIDALVKGYPQLGAWKEHLRLAVNREYVSARHILRDRDEVAIIPPVSGG